MDKVQDGQTAKLTDVGWSCINKYHSYLEVRKRRPVNDSRLTWVAKRHRFHCSSVLRSCCDRTEHCNLTLIIVYRWWFWICAVIAAINVLLNAGVESARVTMPRTDVFFQKIRKPVLLWDCFIFVLHKEPVINPTVRAVVGGKNLLRFVSDMVTRYMAGKCSNSSRLVGLSQ